mmetsp:Transcript_4662/g.7059  ORF Transcript_4662/g.7059 Transcript_4662/m.7059 type:complete len:121 (+) Transcript_4662:970-1332(+)
MPKAARVSRLDLTKAKQYGSTQSRVKLRTGYGSSLGESNPSIASESLKLNFSRRRKTAGNGRPESAKIKIEDNHFHPDGIPFKGMALTPNNERNEQPYSEAKGDVMSRLQGSTSQELVGS